MKDWIGNKKSTFVTLGASNHTEKEREKNDFYATQPEAIDKLVGAIKNMLPKKVWECACGTGCLSDRLKDFGYDVVSSDLIDRGYGDVANFLKTIEMPTDCNCIITNPPYKYATEFVKHSLELLKEGGLCAMFLKTTFLEGQKRYDEIFSTTPPIYVLQFSKRITCALNADFKNCKSSAIAYAWYIWQKGYKGETIVKWFN